MFDTPDLLTPTLDCLSAVLVVLGLVFLGGLIPAVRIIRNDTVNPLRSHLAVSVGVMSVGALGIVILFVLVFQMSVMNQWQVSHGFDQAICLETQINGQYKMTLTQLLDGTEYAEIVGPNREPKIFRIEQYAIEGNFVTGQSDQQYFWFDLRTGAYRYLDDRDGFLESLGPIGLPASTVLLSADTLCADRVCIPCSR